MKDHRFVTRPKRGKKGAKGQTRKYRVGARHPGGGHGKSGKRRGQGSIRNPY